MPGQLRPLLALLILSLLPAASFAAEGAGQYHKKPDAWFASPEAKKIAANILSYQSDLGDWPKNTDTTAGPYTGDRKDLHGTFDNSATTDELRFLARMFDATKEPAYKTSFEKGYDHILRAQYPTGGWPQYFPPSKQYHRHITFNDNSMVRLMEFLRETYTSPRYAFLDELRKASARKAFDAGVACILKCQIKVDGKLTAWCAQHDEIDYSARPARAFELVSLSGAESVGIVRLLMSLEKQTPGTRQAIDAAVGWFSAVKITGIRVDQVEDKAAPKGKNKVVVKDPAAPAIWARFYEIGTNKPIFSDRDSVKKYDIAEIGYERRNGYAWYGNWPAALIEKEYPAWKERQ